jgi:hypothetical protein
MTASPKSSLLKAKAPTIPIKGFIPMPSTWRRILSLRSNSRRRKISLFFQAVLPDFPFLLVLSQFPVAKGTGFSFLNK